MKTALQILAMLALVALTVWAVTPVFAEESPPTPPHHTPDRVRMSELLVEAFAAETELTVEEVQAYKDEGMTLVWIAQELGYSGEELTALMSAVSSTALDAAVKEGIVSEEKAEMIISREGKFQFGMIFDNFLEQLGLTKEELAAKLESGMTLHEIAIEQGVEFGGHLARRCGLTREEIIAGIDGGKTLKELCPGMMMPEGGWPKENPFKK
jgi:hypothetical protein